MAEGSIPLLGLIDRLYGGGSQAPLASMPAVDDVYINPVTGDPMSSQMVAKQAAMLKGAGQGITRLAETPGATVQQNPYRPGTEEHAQFENDRQDAMASWSPAMAMTMMGGGTPFAESGALGTAGGRLAAVRNPITGKLQVAPQQALTDAFISGGPPVEATPYVPLRANGRFANTRDAGRAAKLTPDKVTAPDILQQPTAMYDLANPPAPVTSRIETPQMNVQPSELARWLAFMGQGTL